MSKIKRFFINILTKLIETKVIKYPTIWILNFILSIYFVIKKIVLVLLKLSFVLLSLFILLTTVYFNQEIATAVKDFALKAPIAIRGYVFDIKRFKVPQTEILLTEKNTVVFNGGFDLGNVSETIIKLKYLDSLSDQGPIYLVLNTRGGRLDLGLDLILSISSLKRRVDTISVKSHSMGFFTVQLLGIRYGAKFGSVMFHSIRGTSPTTFTGSVTSTQKSDVLAVQFTDEMIKQMVSRSNGKQTYQSIVDSYKSGDTYLQVEKAIEQGYLDSMAIIKCDKSMDGFRVESKEEKGIYIKAFMEFAYSKCPTSFSLLSSRLTLITPNKGSFVFGVDLKENKLIIPENASSIKLDPSESLEMQDIVKKYLIELTSRGMIFDEKN